MSSTLMANSLLLVCWVPPEVGTTAVTVIKMQLPSLSRSISLLVLMSPELLIVKRLASLSETLKLIPGVSEALANA